MSPYPTALLCLPLALGLLVGCEFHRSAASPDDPVPSPALVLPALVPDPDGKVRLTPEEWRARLTPEQYRVLREAGTEAAFCGAFWKTEGTPGVYHCAGCGVALFESVTKFDSGTGWPSFSLPVAPDRVLEREDRSHGMVRVENICARCDGHLGHVFPHASSDTGRRYCMNSAALVFVPAEAKEAAAQAQP